MYFEPVDERGRALAVGDTVRLTAVPPDVARMPEETRTVFAAALGEAFRVTDFDEYGLARLEVTRDDTIWVEPHFLRRARRCSQPPDPR